MELMEAGYPRPLLKVQHYTTLLQITPTSCPKALTPGMAGCSRVPAVTVSNTLAEPFPSCHGAQGQTPVRFVLAEYRALRPHKVLVPGHSPAA